MTADRATDAPPRGFQDQLARAATVLVESLDMDPVQAVEWLRAYAVVTGRTLADVAADIAPGKPRPQTR